MKEHFTQALDHLKELVAELAARVEKALEQAMEAATGHCRGKAQEIIDGDDAIDRQEIKIEEECLKILALHQPVAGDLRTVITYLKINNELERIGDLAVNIAERVDDMAHYQEMKIANFEFDDMVRAARKMLKKALDSMVYRDVAAAAEVIRLDDEVDGIHRDNYRRVRELIVECPEAGGYYLDCLTVSRCLERAADIATNISEDVIYLEQGRIVRHPAKTGENERSGTWPRKKS